MLTKQIKPGQLFTLNDCVLQALKPKGIVSQCVECRETNGFHVCRKIHISPEVCCDLCGRRNYLKFIKYKTDHGKILH